MSTRDNRSSRRTRKPPSSLPDHFARKGYLSVSDLVGPSWCEYNYQYGVLSLSHLPPSQRPATITTESGQTLAASAQRVAQKETTLQAGKDVHTVLEREVAPVLVHVETDTKEDSWALRLLNLWCDVRALLQLEPGAGKSKRNEKSMGTEHACVREVPVYGWIHGVLVMGVIDEIEKRSFDLAEAHGTTEAKAKTWASQEEWKKDQRRKIATGSPKKAKANRSEPPVRTLTSFFSTSQPETQTESVLPLEPAEPKQGWGYFLSDTKTRIAPWLPAEEDQFSARMQCMAYKRLFDGLCLGSLPSPPSSPRAFDPNASPMDWSHTFASLDLDPQQPLSAAFLRDAMPLCESWGTDLALFVAEHDADVCTLHHIRLLLEQAFRELVQDAQRGVGKNLVEGNREEETLGVIQTKLALTYRRQSQRTRRKRKKAPVLEEQSHVPRRDLQHTTLHDVIDSVRQKTPESNNDKPDADHVLSEVAQPEKAPLEIRKSLDALEGRDDALHAIEEAFSSPPPATPRKLHASPPSKTISPQSPSTPSPEADSVSSSILGVVSFEHDPSMLDTFLRKMIAMWKGDRALVGVSLDQIRRCWSCEWMEGCEWRTAQSDRHYRSRTQTPQHAAVQIEVAARTQAQALEEGERVGVEEGDEFWSTLDYDAIEVRDSQGNLLDW